MLYKGIQILDNSKDIFTGGLLTSIDKEIKISIGSFEKRDYVNILQYIIDYVLNSKPEINDNQTIAYYSWLLQFKSDEQGFYEIYEVVGNGEGFIKGCETAISIIGKQSETCLSYNEVTLFPNFSQNIVKSKGVYEGKDIEGIRYDSPAHMCGWWLITDDYDDNINSLMNVHYYDVAFRRPDILKYLALPFGYRFLMDKGTVTISKDE